MKGMPYALVTGASVGIGAAFARLLARKGYSLVLVGHHGGRLQTIATELEQSVHAQCELLVADLTTPEGMALVEARLADDSHPIEVLINNAGFGLTPSFRNSTVDEEQAQLNILVTAPMRFCHTVLPVMLGRGRGYIINVGSVAAFIPANTYSAAKSYVTYLSESLNSQLADSGIHVTVVAPGYTHTEFHQRAGMDMSKVPEAMWLDANDVAEQAWDDVMRGKAVCVPGAQYRALTTLAQYLPRPVVRRVATRRPGPKLRD